MKSSNVLLLVCLILTPALGVVGCGALKSEDNEKEVLFYSLFPDCSMNSEIRFSPSNEEHDFRDPIYLASVNSSEKTIIFPTGSNTKILSFNAADNQWVELMNDVKYHSSPEPYIYMSPAKDLLNHMSVVIIPVQPANITVTDIRVVITGHIFENNIETSECVGSFIDLSING